MQHSKVAAVLMTILAFLLVFNQWQLESLHQSMVGMNNSIMAQQTTDQQTAASPQESNDLVVLAQQILPRGVPPIYGAELGVSFDDPAAAIPILSRSEQDTRPNKLTGEKLERYIKIGQMTSCEFCCGAKTMVFPDGRKACGCDHSAAMRVEVAYLLDQYGDQATRQQILIESNKWKAVFFPGPTTQKCAATNGLITAPTQGLQQQFRGC